MSRRNGSVSRAVEAASKNRLHMDRNPTHSRINDPANPAGRRKEIDNVMKRARQASPGSWDRKLLEVEEKDPNRWRHTGYKRLYVDGGSPSPRRSRSPPPRRSRTPLNVGRRSRSPVGLGRARSPVGLGRARSPMGLGRRSRSPVGLGRRSRSPIGGLGRRTRSPIGRRSPRRSRSPRRTPVSRRSAVRSPARRPPRPRSPRRESPRPHKPPRQRPPSPPPQRKSRSVSGSSASSCSDESCSVCSAKNKKQLPPPPNAANAKPRPGGSVSPRPKRVASVPVPSRAVQPTRELLKARDDSKRSREEKVLEWQRSQLAVSRSGAAPAPIPPQHIKREGSPRAPRPRHDKPRPVSPAAIAAALNDDASSDESDDSEEPQPQRLTLSERFGKMAQWSAARSARLENMRITRRDTALHVHIEPGNEPAGAVPSTYPGVEEAPEGSYPEELLSAAPGGLPSWDDVRVRYDYYKKRGYLRGLTLGDYVKWEEWWYKYQEWLKRERAYERWADGEQPVRRERRRRGGRQRRS